MSEDKNFFQQVYDVVRRVPAGYAVTYGQIAHMLGRPRGARMVGWAMRACPDELPWQRVVMADGTVTGGEFAAMRRAMLHDEGVPFLPDGRVNLAECQWRPAP